jgi:ketosteroid isomerase-like protein
MDLERSRLDACAIPETVPTIFSTARSDMRCHPVMITALLGLALSAACQQPAPADPAEVRRIIEEHNARIVRWYAGAQADSVGAVFAQDAWQMPPNMPPLVGRDSIVAFWRTATQAGQWRFQLTTEDVAVQGGLAAERGRYTVEFVAGPNAPLPSFEDRGNYVVVWRQETDGVWRAVWDAPVSTVPLPSPTGPPGQ